MFLNEDEKSALLMLTRKSGSNYFEYINQIKMNSIAREVKLNDIKHNMDLSRLREVSDDDKRRNQKYLKAYQILIDR